MLLGMDVLKHFDFHCGDSKISNLSEGIYKDDYIFIGCLKSNICPAYIEALRTYLGYLPVVQNGKK